jgi:hypothetical protein
MEEFRTPNQVHNYFATLASKKKIDSVVSEMASELPLCTISLNMDDTETDIHVCDVEIVEWLHGLKMISLKSVAKQLGIFKNLSEKSNIKSVRDQIASHVAICKKRH